MRGIAAILVVVGHVPQFFPPSKHPIEAYLAVDFFFVLSGAVIAHNYANRLTSGMTVAEFLKVRLIRLYPLYFLGIAIALIGWLLAPQYSGASMLLFLALGAFYLPYLGSAAPAYFPLNLASWSLFQELVANAAYAYACRKHKIKSLSIAAMCLSFFGLLLTAHVKGSLKLGWSPISWHGIDMGMVAGFSRVGFSLFAGVVVYRLYSNQAAKPRSDQLRTLLLLCAVGLILVAHPSLAYRKLYDLTMVLFAFPAIVYFGMVYQPRGRVADICKFLGLTSYAVYCIHLPLVDLITRLGMRPNGYAFIASIVALAWIADRVYDIPVRRWLNAKSRSQRQQMLSPPA